MSVALALVLEADAENPTPGDLMLVNGQLVLCGKDQPEPRDMRHYVAQQIWARLRLHRGGWFLDRRQGVPWFDDILVKGASVAAVAVFFRRLLLGTPGVATLRSFSLTEDRRSRRLQLSFEVVASDGTVVTQSDVDDPFYSGGPQR